MNYEKHKGSTIENKSINKEYLNYEKHKGSTTENKPINKERLNYKKQDGSTTENKPINKEYLNYEKHKGSTIENKSIKTINKNNLIKSFQDSLAQIQNHSFSLTASNFIGRVLNFNTDNHLQYFLETIGDALTGSSPRHWRDKTYSQFQSTLRSVKTEVEMACEIALPQFKGQSVFAYLDKGTQTKRFIKLGALLSLDKSLKPSTEKIKKILKPFDEADKKKIIITLLKEALNSSLQDDSLSETINSMEPELNV